MTVTLKYDYEKAHALIVNGMGTAEAGRKTGIPYAALYSWLSSHKKLPKAQAVKRRKRPVSVKHTTIEVPHDLTQSSAHAVTVVVIRGTSDSVLPILRGMNL